MAYKALYRKYRPMSFGDVVGQEHITDVLKNELKSNKVFHTYLFTGPRGTGKTSCAKILAKAVNCLNQSEGDACCDCEACRQIEEGNTLDIVEMDAASNRGIENIRDIRDRVSYTPASLKYRVYIIDEVHMLTNESFNALLKTLEEPPAHVVFILATTEVQQLPATILSRCQRFDFKRIEPEIISNRIKFVVEKEGLTIDDDAADLLAALADGGMRDALSALDLCAANTKNITQEDVRKSCAMISNEYLIEIADCVLKQETGRLLEIIDGLYKNSIDMLRLCNELITHFRNLMVAKCVPKSEGLIVCSKADYRLIKNQAEEYNTELILYAGRVLGETLDRMAATGRREEFELGAIKLCNPQLSNSIEAIMERISRLEQKIRFRDELGAEGGYELKQKESPSHRGLFEKVEETAVKPKNNNPDSGAVRSATDTPQTAKKVSAAQWREVLKELEKTSPLLVGMLKESSAYINGTDLLVDCESPQFLALVRKNKNYRDHIKNAAFEVFGIRYRLGPYNRSSQNEPVQDSDPISQLEDTIARLEIPEGEE